MKFLTFLFIALFAITAVHCYDNSPIVNKILQNFIEESPKELFKVWHLIFQRKYTLDSDEAKLRFRTFKANLAHIKEHNAKNLPYKLGLNQFSDLTKEEFAKQYLTLKTVEDPAENFLDDDDDDDLTKRNLQNKPEINWTNSFPDVRDQGQCGSCWAFSASGAIDGNRVIKLKVPAENTSTQNLVDCDKRSLGCNGGHYVFAFSYVKQQGLMFEKDYPYNAADGQCNFNSNASLARISGYKWCSITTNSRKCSENVVYGLLRSGPLSVSLDASGNFGMYSSGIFSESCSQTNHAVILAGYGVDPSTGVAYWLIRNSWGASWGDKGYIKVAVNEANNNSCFITARAYLPIVTN